VELDTQKLLAATFPHTHSRQNYDSVDKSLIFSENVCWKFSRGFFLYVMSVHTGTVILLDANTTDVFILEILSLI